MNVKKSLIGSYISVMIYKREEQSETISTTQLFQNVPNFDLGVRLLIEVLRLVGVEVASSSCRVQLRGGVLLTLRFSFSTLDYARILVGSGATTLGMVRGMSQFHSLG
jgi:hypothetical protein